MKIMKITIIKNNFKYNIRLNIYLYNYKKIINIALKKKIKIKFSIYIKNY